MPYRLLIASVAALALALAPQAVAKGVDGATVCGVDTCASADRDDLGPELMGGTPAMPPTEAAPWYRATLEMGDGRPGGRVYDTFKVNVLPQAGLIRGRDGYGGSLWRKMSSQQQAIYRRLTSGIAPFPAQRLKGVAEPEPASGATSSATASADGDDSMPWVLIGAAAAALAAALWALGLARRRRASPASAA